MTSGPFQELQVSLSVDGVRAVVDVIGEVDFATAPTLGGLLETLVDHGHTDIVLDMAALEFFDASGVRVLVRVLGLLRPWQGRLSLRSVPAHTRRVLDITGFTDLIETAPAERASRVRARTSRVAGGRIAPRGIQRHLGAHPTTNDTIDAALRLVVELTSVAVRGADGVSVSLYRHGQLMTAAASDATVLEMDRNQYETGEGPCLSAAAEGHWVRIDALADEDRWPNFVPRAMEDGIASVLSSPLLTDDQPMGALNIYSRDEGAFGRGEQELAALFAGHVTRIIADAGADVPEEEWTARLNEALHSRRVIAQAQGMLMEREQIPADAAAAILASSSRAAERTVLDESRDLTKSVLDVDTRIDHG